MDELRADAVTVLQELLKSDSEAVRLQAAATIVSLPASALASSLTKSTSQEVDGSGGVSDVIRSKRFELVSEGGQVLAVLGEVEKHPFDGSFVVGGVGLALLDRDGRPQVRLLADNHDGTIAYQGLTIYDKSNEYRVNVSAGLGGGGLRMDYGANGTFEVFITGESPIVRFRDRDDKVRLFCHIDGMKLIAGDGKVLFEAP